MREEIAVIVAGTHFMENDKENVEVILNSDSRKYPEISKQT